MTYQVKPRFKEESMEEVGTEVTLIAIPVEGDRVLYTAARQCYWIDKPGKTLIEDAFDKNVFEYGKLIEACKKSGHLSVLEHASFTWQIKCSRACSHQIVRHRLASYSQQSQRYCTFDNLKVITPEKVKSNMVAHFAFKMVIGIIERIYRLFILLGIPGEDARSILPNCTRTEIVTTMNCRELIHFFEERCCYRAQSEINEIASQMLEKCKAYLPSVFNGSGPKCMQLKRCPELKPCGLAPWKAENK